MTSKNIFKVLLTLIISIETAAAQIAAQNGFLHAGNIPNSSAFDEWTLTTSQQSDLVVSVGTDFSPYLQIYDSDNNLLAQILGNGGDRIAELNISSAPIDTYRVRVGPRFGHSGDYIFTIVSTSEAAIVATGDEGGLVAGVEAEGASLPLGDLDVWTVSADEGNTIISRLGTEFSPAIRIYGPDGNLVASKFGNGGDRTADLTVEAITSGIHTVIVSGRFSQEGDYALTLVSIPKSFSTPAGDQGGLLTPDNRTQGDLFLGDLDFWRFPVVQGDRVMIRGETEEAAIAMRLYDGTGNLVSFLNGNGADRDRTLVYDAILTGELYLSVGTYFIGTSTPYALTLDIMRPEITIVAIDGSGADLNWTGFPDLILEGSEDLNTWNPVISDSQLGNGIVSGRFETSIGRGFFRSRWE